MKRGGRQNGLRHTVSAVSVITWVRRDCHHTDFQWRMFWLLITRPSLSIRDVNSALVLYSIHIYITSVYNVHMHNTNQTDRAPKFL